MKKAGKKYKPKPKKKKKKRKFGIGTLQLADGGKVPSIRGGRVIWSDSYLINLGSHEALLMEKVMVNDKEHLFVEIGGFSATHKPDWKSSYYVMVRK